MKTKHLIPILFLLVTLSISVIPTLQAEPTQTTRLNFDVSPWGEMMVDESESLSDFSTGLLTFNLDLADIEQVTNTGEGVYVAVLDTGLLKKWRDYLPAERIKKEWGIGFTHRIKWDRELGDFDFSPVQERNFITDRIGSGHGTHVTSIITGYSFYGTPITGVAPKATIIPVLVLDAWIVKTPFGDIFLSGGTDEMIVAGIRYVADLAEREGIKIIINMSLGGPSPTGLIEDAIDYAISKGVIIVAAAGNSGTAQMDWPGAYPQVISAAAGGWTYEFMYSGWWLDDVPEALDTPDLFGNNRQTYLTDFSSRANPDLGQSWKDLDVSAPGAAVVGPYKPYGYTPAGYYYVWGTSQATPHVAGIAALILQDYPDINQPEMEDLLELAASRIPLPSDGSFYFDVFAGGVVFLKWEDHEYGTGLLTADEALWAASTHA